MILDESCGAVFGWAWFKFLGQYWWVMQYWPMAAQSIVRSQRVDRRPMVRRAGAMDWTRGRHWDRRSRYGLR